MKSIVTLTYLTICLVSSAPAQNIERVISEDYVRSLVTTLAADDMNGREALKATDIKKAGNYIEHQFKKIGLKPLKGTKSFRQEFVPDDYPGQKMFNVVGVLPGKVKPDEYVIFSAHYDHIGTIAPIAGDSIANGADDDASGTTAVIALAKYFKAMNNNARTLIFVAFTAEEVGGFGSQYFTTQFDPASVIAMFNIEMIGKPSKWGQNTAFITGFELSDFGKILQRNVAGTKFSFRPDPYPEQHLFFRSDNARLAAKGVPAHSISTDQIDKDPYYHTVDDEVATLDIANMAAAIRAIALGARSIVAGVDTPTRLSIQ